MQIPPCSIPPSLIIQAEVFGSPAWKYNDVLLITRCEQISIPYFARFQRFDVFRIPCYREQPLEIVGCQTKSKNGRTLCEIVSIQLYIKTHQAIIKWNKIL